MYHPVIHFRIVAIRKGALTAACTRARNIELGHAAGSGCNPDGMGCQNLFTFVISDTNGPLSLSDSDTFVAGHVANGAGSGFIATGGSPFLSQHHCFCLGAVF